MCVSYRLLTGFRANRLYTGLPRKSKLLNTVR
jgi:hypothetical protein